MWELLGKRQITSNYYDENRFDLMIEGPEGLLGDSGPCFEDTALEHHMTLGELDS